MWDHADSGRGVKEHTLTINGEVYARVKESVDGKFMLTVGQFDSPKPTSGPLFKAMKTAEAAAQKLYQEQVDAEQADKYLDTLDNRASTIITTAEAYPSADELQPKAKYLQWTKVLRMSLDQFDGIANKLSK